MSGMCKSDARQNSKRRTKFAAQVIANTWETHKDKVAKRQAAIRKAKRNHLELRAATGKPERGDARARRRENPC